MTARFNPLILLPTICCFILCASPVSVCLGLQDANIEFFESRIRPILIEHCYVCHNSVDQTEADFALDWRIGIRSETERGTGIVPGKPADSLLLQVIEHRIEGLEMPEDGAKLSREVIADFKKWIGDGAVDPRNEPPSKTELKAATSWESTLESRKQWWSFQPVRKPELPAANDWSDHPIDRFIFESAKTQQLHPGEPAEKRELLRRLSFALTGLPPTLEQLSAFENGSTSFEEFVDQMLASPRFGERWARHWMDLVRYADSHGSEGDPAIPNAFQYRDYLIRAFNADVPYDQFVREQIAGDLLENPRINQELGINESAIGPAHWRLCFHGFAPTDALDEKVRFTDDQINVFSKAFLGLTVSCARCHNHKFDAISQSDYYALFGIIGSCRPAMIDANTPEKKSRFQGELVELKRAIKEQVAAAWLKQVDPIAERLIGDDDSENELVDSAKSPGHVLSIFKNLSETPDGDFASAWAKQVKEWQKQRDEYDAGSDPSDPTYRRWNFASATDVAQWFGDGNLPLAPGVAGEFALAPSGDTLISSIYPAGVYSNLISDRHRAVMGSPRFPVSEKLTAWVRCLGGGQSTLRYVVQNYPRSGTVYPIYDIHHRNWQWRKLDLNYWHGDEVYLEVATAQDAPLQVRNVDESWFGIRDVVVRNSELGPPAAFELEFLTPLFETAQAKPPQSKSDLARCYVTAAAESIQAWKNGTATDEQAMFLDALVRDAVLPNTLETLPSTSEAVQQYRGLEQKIPRPFRVPGVAEADSFDQSFFERGDHRKPQQPVPRRFLEAIDPAPYQASNSGRLELANDLFRVDNPLTSRVVANRIWHYLFGRGLVSTPDNFGRLGAKPSHPELLDYLASRMIEQGWSFKETIRFIVTSKSWQQTSSASEKAVEVDPENNLLSHFSLRRLDAEAIRDSIFQVSGRLTNEMYGPSVPQNSIAGRRAVYIRAQRNDLDKFLATFDSPVPFATTGRRNLTNVPAQSLTLLNSPLVIEQANQFANRIRNNKNLASGEEKIRAMFELATGREPTSIELDSLSAYLGATDNTIRARADQKAELSQVIAQSHTEIDATLKPVKMRLLESKASSGKTGGPIPNVHWDFSAGLVDSINGLKLSLRSGAKIKGGALILDGNGFALSDPIPGPIVARTLEATVQLDNLNQKGGGVVTIQNLSGSTFDSIVFAELKNKRWLAGSNNHVRTLPLEGKPEKQAVNQKVHLAITYSDDGTITAYRDGRLYGKPIRKSGIQKYEPRKTKIALGIRHGKQPRPGRMLSGKIFEVRIYDRALSAEEVASAFSRQPTVSDAEILAELEPKERQHVSKLREIVENHLQTLERMDDTPGPHDPLARVAHAIFNLKEFIYVR